MELLVARCGRRGGSDAEETRTGDTRLAPWSGRTNRYSSLVFCSGQHRSTLSGWRSVFLCPPACFQGLELLVQNLSRLDESNEEDAKGVNTTMGVLENLLEVRMYLYLSCFAAGFCFRRLSKCQKCPCFAGISGRQGPPCLCLSLPVRWYHVQPRSRCRAARPFPPSVPPSPTYMKEFR